METDLLLEHNTIIENEFCDFERLHVYYANVRI